LYYLFNIIEVASKVVNYLLYDVDIDQFFNDNYYLILLVTTTIFVCLTLKFFSYNAHLAAQAAEEAANESRSGDQSSDAQLNQQQSREPPNQIQIYEMTSSNYEKLVSKSPRGYRTILLVGMNGDHELLNLFGRVCQNYCK
jgi:hypothetical protein